SSIDRISSTTQFGTKKLLDGSAGVVAGPTSSNISSIYLSGTFGGAALTTNSAISIAVTTKAEQAVVASATFASATIPMNNTGSFTIIGTVFSVSAGNTVADVVNRINSASATTGVQAVFTDGGAITLTSL